MGWLNFGGKKRDRAQGFGDASKTKSRKRPKSFILEKIVTPSASIGDWQHEFDHLHQLLGSLSLPDLHLPNFLADSGVCPIDPSAPTNNLPPLIDFDPLGLYHDGIATQTPYNPGGAFETLPIALIPVDPHSPNPSNPNAIRQLLNFPLASQPLVGSIDTGVSADSPYLNYANIKKGRDYVGGDDNPLLKAGEGSEHGTFMLGIIDAINKTAPKWVGRAIDSGRWADSLVEFVDAAKASGQKNAIANLSLDLTQKNADGSVTTRYELTTAERSAIEYARQNGVMLVAAAGNDGGVMSVLGQASQEFDNIFTVGAGDINGRSNYSSYGRGLDIVADGGTSEHPALSTAGNDLGTMAGTSVATAKVAGAASLVWAANPALNYRQVMEILKSTARDLGPVGWDDETGFGFLNTLAAVDLAKKTTPEVYEIPATVVPDTWSGEGKVTPSERAVNFNGRINNVGDVKVTGSLRIRFQPNTSSAEVAKITPGTQLEFLDQPVQGGMVTDTSGLGSSSTWYRLANGSGYMSALYIQNVGSIPAPKPAPTPAPAPKPTPTPTPAPAPKPTPTPTPAPAPKPTPTPTPAPAPKPTPTPTPAPAPAPKPIPQVPISSNSANYRNGAVNPFAYRWQGQCTWYAYGRMLETGLLPAAIKNNALFRGNAEAWKNDALKVGLPVTSTPTAGARGLVVWPPYTQGTRQWGHVAFLEEVYPDGRVRITEANWPTGSGIKERILTPAQYAGVSFVRLENAQTNSYNAPPATPGKQRQYIVRSGDTLSGIAQRELGNANRWGEIVKTPTGGTFTAAEAQQLRVGQSVYLPVSSQTGTGTPVTLASNQTGKVSSPVGYVNVRPSASTVQAAITTLNNGTTVQVVKKVTGSSYDNGRTDWYEVIVNGKTAYIAGAYLSVGNVTPTPTPIPTPTPSQTGKVSSPVGYVNVRPSASTAQAAITTLNNGTTVQVVKKVTGSSYDNGRTDWYEVIVNGKTAYIAGAYLSVGNATPTPTPTPTPIGNGQRITDAVNKVNPDHQYYQPGNLTFCNWFVADVLDQLRVPIPRDPSAGAYFPNHPIYRNNPPAKPKRADLLYDFFNSGGGGKWQRVTASEAVARANNGRVVVASSRPNLGHIAIVIPGSSGSNVRIAQAGRYNSKNTSAADGFGQNTPSYFEYIG
ncbi:SH3 domain-containing protein [Microcoleus sp. EPA2]|uniref:SH3 domain-containing protein n=1 Tax=Microcoleus sp. EPA2 TaxID=2841654 RepID=UPI00312B70D7